MAGYIPRCARARTALTPRSLRVESSMMSVLTGKCPDEFYCHDKSHGFSVLNETALRLLPSYLGIVSSTLSLLGSLLILCAYCAFKDLRRGTAQTIITVLAIADVGTSLSLLLGIFNFLAYDHFYSGTTFHRDAVCLNFYTVCQIQAFVMVGFAISSYIWTSVLAIHFLLSTVFSRNNWSEKLMPVYTIVAWTLPLLFLLPLLITGKLGYTPTYQATCYISAEAIRQGTSKPILLAEQLVSWCAEAAFGIVTIVCYIIIFAYICSKRRELQFARRVGKRLLAIPAAYLFLRLWDAAQVGLAMTILKEPLACSPKHSVQVASFVISVFQMTFPPGQGLINCILYIFLSPELRKRMFILPFKRCMQRCVQNQPRHVIASSEADPLINNTKNTPSTRTKARERGDTYYSFPTDMPKGQTGTVCGSSE